MDQDACTAVVQCKASFVQCSSELNVHRDIVAMNFRVECRYHSPDLFITFTCNPKWEEIQSVLPIGHVHTDHPDIVARVFWLKFKYLMSDIVDRPIFGAVQAFVWRIERQARGPPHVHVLVTFGTMHSSISLSIMDVDHDDNYDDDNDTQ